MTATLRTLCLLAIGGALGTLARYGVGLAAAQFSQSMPWGTISINVAGSFAIGFFGTLTLASGRYPLAEDWRVFFMVGVCGGFTTFSAFSLQTLDLLRGGSPWRAAANVIVSVTLCVIAVTIGHLFAARINGGAEQIAQASVEEEA